MKNFRELVLETKFNEVKLVKKEKNRWDVTVNGFVSGSIAALADDDRYEYWYTEKKTGFETFYMKLADVKKYLEELYKDGFIRPDGKENAYSKRLKKVRG